MRIFVIIPAFLFLLYTNASIITAIPKKTNSFSYITKQINVAGQRIIRSTPIIDDIATEGIDEIFSEIRPMNNLNKKTIIEPSANFILTPEVAIERALKHQARSLLHNPYKENIAGLYTQVFIMHFNQLRPAFKIRLPTVELFDLKDIYIDGENGELLRIDDAAQFANAKADIFVYSPTSSNLLFDIKPITLTNLLDVKENQFIKGEHISVKNCCKYYSCPNDGPCEESEKRCANKSHKNIRQKRELVELPADQLGLDSNTQNKETLFIDTVRCTHLPSAKAGYLGEDGNGLGFFDKPIDDATEASETDRFSEIQAYFSISSFFYHIRNLLDDDTWCLRKEAMLCHENGSAILDKNKNPIKPYQVFVNQLIPNIKPNQQNLPSTDDIISQIKNGRGDRNNPIMINKLARIGNAAFVPALNTLKSPPRPDEVLSDLIRDFDHNVFFQGERDFAYDGDVVFHEFMHAVTTSLIGKPNTLGLDLFGINSEPGALNEGWSDYFSATFTNKPTIGEYASTNDGFGETALRNINNEASCPNNVTGESHNDSLIWSGALWEIREKILQAKKDAIEFDRAVLASLAQALISDDFKIQSQKLLDNIRIRPHLGDEVAKWASQIFAKRKINNCFRVYSLSYVDDKNIIRTSNKDVLFITSKNQIGLKNYAPSPIQLAVNIPIGTKEVKLSFKQYLAGNVSLMGKEITNESITNLEPLAIISNVGEPIKWHFQDAKAVPNNVNTPLKIIETTYKNGYWQAIIPLESNYCHFDPMYISILGRDLKYVLENIHVSFDIDENQKDMSCEREPSNAKTKGSVGCTNNSATPLFAFIMLIILYIRGRLAENA